jgi:hypothetical protein
MNDLAGIERNDRETEGRRNGGILVSPVPGIGFDTAAQAV